MEVPAAAARRTAIAAVRGALQTTHSAANLVNSVDKEAARMLRTAEGLARSAVARLEFLAREATIKKQQQEKEVKTGKDAAMADATAGASARPRRRGRRSQRASVSTAAPAAMPLADAASPPLAAAAQGCAPRRTLKPQSSRERSPRREASPSRASSIAATQPGLGGLVVGQPVVLSGLTSRSDLHGSLGTVMSFDVAAGRVAVKVSASGECIKVKPCNLEREHG